MKAYSQQLALTNLSKSDNNNVYILAAGNLARGKPTDQSTASNSGNAVNGNYDDFTHTTAGKHPSWWRVDLGDIYSIRQIKLYNRRDCCRKLYYTINPQSFLLFM